MEIFDYEEDARKFGKDKDEWGRRRRRRRRRSRKMYSRRRRRVH